MQNMCRVLVIPAIFLLIMACGSSGGDEDTTETATVSVRVTDGSASDAGLIKALTAVADSAYVTTYSFCLSTSTCSSGLTDADFSCVIDKEADGTVADADTDCTNIADDPDDATVAVNIAGVISEAGSSDSFTAGDYHCVRVKMCDNIAIQADVGDCETTASENFTMMDVSSNEDNIPEVATFYWSTDGSSEESGDPDDSGSIDNPMELTSAVSLTAGTTNTVTVTMSNVENIDDATTDGMYISDEDIDLDGEACDMPQPNMSISSS